MNITVVIVSIVFALFGIYLFYTFRKMKNMPMVQDHDKIKILTSQNFQSQIKTGITLVDFWAEWCMPCKMMAPILNSTADELNGNAFVGKLNIEQHQSIATQYKVRSIPTLIMFKNGKEISRFVGVKTKDFLVKEIKKVQ
jgi:thioredoxin 1